MVGFEIGFLLQMTGLEDVAFSSRQKIETSPRALPALMFSGSLKRRGHGQCLLSTTMEKQSEFGVILGLWGNSR